MILYFLVENEKKSEPYSLEELKSKRITSTTLVWKEGLLEWVEASELPEFEKLIYSEPPPIPERRKVKTEEISNTLLTNEKTDGNELEKEVSNDVVIEFGVKKVNPIAKEIRNIFYTALIAIVLAACTYPYFMSEINGNEAREMLSKWDAAIERSSFSGWAANKDKPGASEKYVKMMSDLREESYDKGFRRPSYGGEPTIYAFQGHFEKQYNKASEASFESSLESGVIIFGILLALRYLFLGGKWVSKNS